MVKSEWVVGVVDYGREFPMLRARNRSTGRVKSKRASSNRRRDAVAEAAKWEVELNASGLVESPRLSKAAEMFEASYLLSRRPGTRVRTMASLKRLGAVVGDPRLSSITESTMGEFIRYYSQRVALTTLSVSLIHIRCFLRWAHRQRLVSRVPNVEMPKVPPKMGGRVLTTEECERALSKVPMVRPGDPELWRFLIWGMWCSGLRIGEACNLSWDADSPVRVVPTGRGRWQIEIEATHQKAGRLTKSPAAPEFAEMLESVPESERRGRVFKVPVRLSSNVGAVITACFRAAGVDGSSHDLRRSFCTRWAKVLAPQFLMRLMRHKSISTTLAYYVGDLGLEDALYQHSGNKSGNSRSLPYVVGDGKSAEKQRGPVLRG